MVTRATGEHDLRDVEVSASDRLMVQQVLALLARFGAQVHETFISRVDPAIVANPEILVITTLDVEGELRPSEIVELTGISSSGVTKLIDRLEGHGIVVRQVGTVPGDRRVTRVVLTPEGQRAARQLAAGLASQMELVRALIAELQEVTEG
jgi:DNA-binding MarR family transcriptional regulator